VRKGPKRAEKSRKFQAWARRGGLTAAALIVALDARSRHAAGRAHRDVRGGGGHRGRLPFRALRAALDSVTAATTAPRFPWSARRGVVVRLPGAALQPSSGDGSESGLRLNQTAHGHRGRAYRCLP
jgi:hypothetical protein